MIVLTGLTLAVLYCTARINSRLANDTARMAAATNRYAEVADKQLHASMRPWIIPRRLALLVGGQPHIMVVRYQLQNHGNMLALDCVPSIHVIQQMGEELHTARIDQKSGKMFVGGNSEQWTTTAIRWPVGTNWQELLRTKDTAGQPVVVLKFTITTRYRSATGKRYWTYSCSQYHADANNFFVLTEDAGEDDGGDQPVNQSV